MGSNLILSSTLSYCALENKAQSDCGLLLIADMCLLRLAPLPCAFISSCRGSCQIRFWLPDKWTCRLFDCHSTDLIYSAQGDYRSISLLTKFLNHIFQTPLSVSVQLRVGASLLQRLRGAQSPNSSHVSKENDRDMFWRVLVIGWYINGCELISTLLSVLFPFVTQQGVYVLP